MIDTKRTEFSTTFIMPVALRGTIDRMRLARSRRSGGLPPSFREVVLEALLQWTEREKSARK